MVFHRVRLKSANCNDFIDNASINRVYSAKYLGTIFDVKFVYPYLTYCIEVWGCAYPTYLQCLFLLQINKSFVSLHFHIILLTQSHYLCL